MDQLEMTTLPAKLNAQCIILWRSKSKFIACKHCSFFL